MTNLEKRPERPVVNVQSWLQGRLLHVGRSLRIRSVGQSRHESRRQVIRVTESRTGGMGLSLECRRA